jgi:hypothetical protein
MTKTRARVLCILLAGGFGVGACGTSHHDALAVDQAARSGVLSGQLTIEGGPPRGGNLRPMPGTVTFRQHGREVATAHVGADGRFSETLPPGSYQVQACTAEIQTVDTNGHTVDTCAATIHADVSADRTTTVQLPTFIVP